MPIERHLEWLNAYICFKLLSSLGNLSFSRNCQMVTQSAVHVTTRLIWPELICSTTFVSKIRGLDRIRRDSLGVKTSNANPIFCG